ncbi:MAG: Crp/Fnr family transcriptional regulator [Gammaproteobacteria bacterium]|jgi:CRP/FNR family transcriptional regulator|nr:Crp/Fnr family transcriptional regulator [Gammaproteobacteria bacterium]MBT3490175.1 Crp/Fnr family transcriptional regulator [Gammaproteobacteria bacterium]MBT3718762.1 Crp/Fnr family transcriptional regulator [Gammaproteobacteria bacterium]MBT3845745.1 Crp/Fnr family transcriptional regulator [Gammaproteobacteria bacterium]MBT3892027.1 Crp/Fnr family transcriptional regulator [Gammaproteobacteria bacterium]
MTLSPIYKNEVRRSKLFSTFNETVLDQIFLKSKIIYKKSCSPLFNKGDPATHFYVVRSGCAKQFLTSPDGHEKTLNVIRPGSALAEIQVFLQQAEHCCNGEMLEGGELFEFNCQTYLQVLQQQPEYALPLIRNLSQKIQQQMEEIGHLTLVDARYRLTHYIFSQIECRDKYQCDSNTQTCKNGEGCSLKLPTSKATIASLLSIQRETFSRILGKMKAENMISVKGSEIQITNLKKLRDSVL